MFLILFDIVWWIHSPQRGQPQIHDAKEFLERVKQTFKDDKGVYDQFVDIMKNFKHDKYVFHLFLFPFSLFSL